MRDGHRAGRGSRQRRVHSTLGSARAWRASHVQLPAGPHVRRHAPHPTPQAARGQSTRREVQTVHRLSDGKSERTIGTDGEAAAEIARPRHRISERHAHAESARRPDADRSTLKARHRLQNRLIIRGGGGRPHADCAAATCFLRIASRAHSEQAHVDPITGDKCESPLKSHRPPTDGAARRGALCSPRNAA